MRERQDPLRIEYLDPLDGLRVVRQAPPPGAESFSATYVGPGGWAYDGRTSAGTARLVNQLVTSGAGPYGRVELARRLDRAGATLSRRTAPESAEVTIWGPASSWEPLLGILALVVQRPRFDADDVRRGVRQLAEHQLRETTQPGHRAERELLHRIFPVGHPYRETGAGSSRTLRALTRSRLVRFHEEHYTGDGGLLVVTTPAGGPAVRRAIRRSFSSFGTSRAPALPRLPAGRPAGEVARIDLPGRSQVEVRVGGPSIARSDPAFAAAYLANEALGGRPLLNRLFQRVRERGGLAYHASSDLEAMRWGGYWVAAAGTGADRWRRVVPMLNGELRRLRRDGLSAAELRTVRESAIGEIPLALESTADAHELAVDAAYHGLAPDHWKRWPSALRDLRPSAVREAARTAFGGQGAVTVVVGPVGSTAAARPPRRR